MTDEERNEIREIVLEELQSVGILLDDSTYFPVNQSPDSSVLLPFMAADGMSYGRVPISSIGGGGSDPLVSVAWTGGGISSSSVRPSGTATLTKGTVTATYQSGRTENVTASAVFRANRGSISGTTYTAPATVGNDTISVSYGSMTAPATIAVTIDGEPVVRRTVQVGHGASYAEATFSDTNRQLTSNMIVTINNNAGDYLFIKVDKDDTVSNLYTYPGPNMSSFEYPIALDAAVIDGDYKYYKSTNRYNAGETSYKINRIN